MKNFLKRFGAILADLLFFTVWIAVSLAVAIFILYWQNKDIAIINTLLQTQLMPTLYVAYAVLFVIILKYFTIVPLFLKATLGQALFGISYTTEGKFTWWKLFLKHIIGPFWDILLFPYTLFAGFTKKAKISTNISGIVVSTEKRKQGVVFYAVTIFSTLALIATIAGGTYVQKVGINQLIEQYTDYEKQVDYLIEKHAYQDAADVLEKYKEYNGETATYWFSSCIIKGNLTTEETTHEICAKAAEQNASDASRQLQITAVEARVYAANLDYEKAESLYAKLWNELNVRTLDMKDYVYVLSELGKNKEATEVLGELEKAVPAENISLNRDIAVLYERLGDTEKALSKYKEILAAIPEGSNQDIAGELNYSVGVILFNQNKPDEAKPYFEISATQNPDYAELAGSYMILINKLLGSIVK